MTKHGSSMPSNHNASSHFNNVRSFSTIASAKVSETPHDEQCPNAASQSSAQRTPGGKGTPPASPVVPDYPSQTPMAQLDARMATPPLLGQSSRDLVTSATEMHTPAVRRSGSDRCDECSHSTPMPGHVPSTQRPVTPHGSTRDEGGGPTTSPIGRPKHEATADGDATSRWYDYSQPDEPPTV